MAGPPTPTPTPTLAGPRHARWAALAAPLAFVATVGCGGSSDGAVDGAVDASVEAADDRGSTGDGGPACRRLDGGLAERPGDGSADDGGHSHPESPVPSQYADLVNPYGYTDRTLAELGEPIYRTSCARCHGADGRGSGFDGRDLTPAPSNLHSVNRLHADPYLFWRIHDGGDLGATFCSDMPAFGASLGDDGIWRVITFVRWRFVDF